MVQIINKLNLSNPKYLFVISYKGAFRLTVESVSECVKINRIHFCWNSYIVGGGGEIQYFGIRTKFDSRRVRHIYLYKSVHVSRGLLIPEGLTLLSRKVSGISCGHSHVRALSM